MQYQIASKGLVFIFSLTILFHLAILTGIIPFDIVWGGKLESITDMYFLESISLILNTYFLFVAFLIADILKFQLPRLERVSLWLMVLVFLMNTVGNSQSENEMEKMIFTPITGLITIFCFILIRKKES